jgi:hypothetical protein
MHKPCENRSVSFGVIETGFSVIKYVNYIIKQENCFEHGINIDTCQMLKPEI